jgi:diguanylate cyclase (GGDEF)-like protein/PAS domain S-box-containing protein
MCMNPGSDAPGRDGQLEQPVTTTWGRDAEDLSVDSSSLVDAIGQAVIATDLSGRITYWNRGATQLYGWAAEQAVGAQLTSIVVPVSGAVEEFAQLRDALLVGDCQTAEVEVVAKDGHRLWVWTANSVIRDAADTPMGVLGISHDVTLRVARERALRESEMRFRALIQRSKDVAVIVDVPGTLHYVSPGVTDLLGFSPAELVGTDGWALVHPEDLERLRNELRVVVSAAGAHTTTEYRIRTADGSYRWVEQTVANMLDEPVIGGVVANLRDVTDRKRVEADLNHRVLHDQLTGLPNRAHLDQALVAALTEGSGAAVLVFDIDEFKLVNDSYGHDVGDELLAQVSARLHHALRPGDLAGRFGGDEFVVVCRNVDDVGEAEIIAGRLQAALEAPFELSGAGRVHVSASVGIAAGGAGISPAELFHDADAAMYEAKRSGRARHAIYDEAMRSRASRRLEEESDLRRAVTDGQFEVQYQPIVGLQSGRLVAVEALARWRHPTRGVLGANEFIELAEETGLVIEMGQQIIDQTFEVMARWDRLGHRLICGINLSPLQLIERGLVESVADRLAVAGLPADRVAFEITETAVMADPKRAIQVVQELVGLGVHVALDDFGTGYSSLAFLKQLPVTSVKIDQGFVDGVDSRPDDYDIVSAVVQLAKAFDRVTIAEGVETIEQVEVLAGLGCDLGQGSYWSRPLTEQEVLTLLDAGPEGWQRTGQGEPERRH